MISVALLMGESIQPAAAYLALYGVFCLLDDAEHLGIQLLHELVLGLDYGVKVALQYFF